MASKRRLDCRDYRRGNPKFLPRFRILIVCEGAVTEPEYFKAFQHDMRNQRVHVEIADETGVPLTVVQTAIRIAAAAAADAVRMEDDNLRYDSAWAVFDVDDHPNLQQARTLAQAHDINLAVSSPCFELWALLHFEDQRAHVDRHVLASLLRKHIPEYEKLLPYNRLKESYSTAVQRARNLELEATHHGQPGRNPSTAVDRLTELIRTQ